MKTSCRHACLLLVALLFLATGCAPHASYVSGEPLVQAWSPDGGRLATGFAHGTDESRLEVTDRNGQVLNHRALPGQILAIAWSSRGDLLVAGYRLQSYSFGANLTQWLFRSHDGVEEILPLGDVTIETATVKAYADDLPRLLTVAFSPSGDELVYARLHDPPQFSPYLQLLYRNWQVADSRKLLDLPVEPVAVTWSERGDAITCRFETGPPRAYNLWPAPAGTRADVPKGEALPEEKHWALRKWRFEGLITPEEFNRAVSAGGHP